MHRIVATGFVAVGLMLGGSAAHAAATPEQRCEAGKKQEAGKYAACRLKAEAGLVQRGDLGRYNTAIGRCAAKLGAKFLKLEAAAVSRGATCPTTSDADDVISYVGCAANVVAEGTKLGGVLSAGCGGSDCGNGSIDAGEDCDHGDLNGGTCTGEGFTGGTLTCGAGCVYDTTRCWNERFIDNLDGTITDNKTGLMWEKKVKLDVTTDYANLQDADNWYSWSGTCSIATSKHCQPNSAASTACFAGVGGDTTGCDECTGGDGVCNVSWPGITIWQWLNDLNAANYGGHNDWRVPVVQELITLVDYARWGPALNVAFYGVSCGFECTDVTDPACSCTNFLGYWSASTYALNPVKAWIGHITDGSVYEAAKADSDFRSVRAVRGGL